MPGRAIASSQLCATAAVLTAGASGRACPTTPQVDDDRAFRRERRGSRSRATPSTPAENTFGTGDQRSIRAVNVTDRRGRFQLVREPHGRRDMPADIARGPNELDADIEGGPSSRKEQRHRLPRDRSHRPPVSAEVDPPEHPEMASGAEVIGAATITPLGYNVVQGRVVDPARIVSPRRPPPDLSGAPPDGTGRHDAR
jgi:hypothetical protein